MKLKIKDSKLLTKKQRESLFTKIIKIINNYKIIVIQPEEIDKAVYGHDGLNLNWLEAQKTVEIINELKPDKVIIDCPSNNIEHYKNHIKERLFNKEIEIIAEHKADIKYLIVSAASILAKVIRDNEIEKIKSKIGIDFGSGYMSDPKTAEFLKENYEKFSYLFRKSWLPYQELINKKYQRRLGDFA
jgi:ribonuclease HII